MKRILVNVLAFQATWLACAFGAANDVGWVGIVAGLAAVAVHLAMTEHWQPEALFVALTGVVGVLVETALTALDLVVYVSSAPMLGAVPVWLIALWMVVATLFAVSIRFLRGRPILGGLLGGLGGAASYAAALEMGVLKFPPPMWIGLTAVVIVWTIVTPALSRLHRAFVPD